MISVHKDPKQVKPVALCAKVMRHASRIRNREVSLDYQKVEAILARNVRLRQQLKERDEYWKDVIRIMAFFAFFLCGILLSTNELWRWW